MAHAGIEIASSVMCMNWLAMERDLRALEALHIDYLHFDIMDGFFVPEFSMSSGIANQIREATTIPSYYHLMVEEPRKTFEQYAPEPGAFFNIHYEACRNLHRDLVALRKLGFAPGLVLNPATTLENIEYVIDEVDMVTIMTVNPGYTGQKLVPQTLAKIERLDEWRRKDSRHLKIAVDGNVSFANTPSMVEAGADVLVVGTSGLFVRGQSLQQSYEQLTSAIDHGLVLRAARAGVTSHKVVAP